MKFTRHFSNCIFAGFAIAALALCACSDDDDSFGPTGEKSDFIAYEDFDTDYPMYYQDTVPTMKNLPPCTKNQWGSKIYVQSKRRTYQCNGDYINTDDDNPWNEYYSSVTINPPQSSSSAGYSSSSAMSSALFDDSLFIRLQERFGSSANASSSSADDPTSSSDVSSSADVGANSSSDTDLSSSSAVCANPTGFQWSGSTQDYFINTGFYNENETAGWWYVIDDHAEGGASEIEWPVPMGNDYWELGMDSIIDYCSGVCGTYTLAKQTMAPDPFISIAFDVAGCENYEQCNLANEVQNSVITADVTKWEGICITYTADADSIFLELSMDAESSAAACYNLPYVQLTPSKYPTQFCTAWNGFRQRSIRDNSCDEVYGQQAAAKLATVKFKIQGSNGRTGEFNITEVSSFKTCNYP